MTIGIAANDGDNGDFSRMYRDAHAALYRARVDGKSNIGLFEPRARVQLGMATMTSSEIPLKVPTRDLQREPTVDAP